MSPDSAAAAIQEYAGALGLDLSNAQVSALLAYVALFARWNRAYNLTAIRDPADILTLHVADSLAVIGPLRRVCRCTPFRLLDVGTGGGLPGVVIAIALPSAAVTCVDAVGKKAAFVRQVAAELRLPNVAVEQARVERFMAAPFDIVASRAFSSLGDLVRLTRHLIKPDGLWMAMKGQVPAAEIATLPKDVALFHVERLHVPGLEAERHLVWIRKIVG